MSDEHEGVAVCADDMGASEQYTVHWFKALRAAMIMMVAPIAYIAVLHGGMTQ